MDQQTRDLQAAPEVSLVIPVQNGAEFISQSVAQARSFLDRSFAVFEIVVVDDGSTDDTAAILQSLADQNVIVVRLPENLGKFGALKAGMAAASGTCRIFTDADLPYDLEALPYIAGLINRHGYDIVVGDRTLPESRSMTDSRVARKLSSRLFSYFVRMLDLDDGLRGRVARRHVRASC